MKKYILFFLFFSLSLVLFAQEANIPLGTWRTHLPYRNVLSIAFAEDKIYAIAESGIFVFDKSDNTTKILGKSDGLSEAQATQVSYASQSKKLIIAYANGNIDLLYNNSIKNIATIKNTTSLTGDKRTNHIFIRNDLAYLSTSFGVVVLDLLKEEIKETWKNLGIGGISLSVSACTADNTSFYLATPQGILFANQSLNLQDFNNWQKFGVVSNLPQVAAQQIVNFQNTIYASLNGQGVYKLISNNWIKVNSITDTNFTSLQFIENQIYICSGNKIIILNSSDQISTLQNTSIKKPNAILKENNSTWIADGEMGLVSDFEGSYKGYSPNGTFSNRNWKTFYYDDKIVALSGGYASNYTNLSKTDGFDIFDNGFWKTYNSLGFTDVQPSPFAFDLTSATYNSSKRLLSLASFGNGIIQQNAQGEFNVIDETTPQTPFFGGSDIKISDVLADNRGNLWVTQYGVTNSLHQQRPDGSWLSFSFNTATRFPVQILLDNSRYKWIRLAPASFAGGIWVVDTEGGQNKHLTPSNSKLTNGNILSMAIDKDGVIWIGSESGIMTVFNSFDVFKSGFEVTFPIFDRRQLLENIAVTTIAIDGANRKWFGTRNNGIYVFDEDITKLIAQYTTENSPLISNEIRNLTIHPKTGEVFITTNQGISSFREGVSVASENFGNVKVYPNPVKPNFDSLVGIEGLTENAEVKITDISGKLIYQTIAKGGTATWNVRDYNGRRASSGIYLVFSGNSQGEQLQVAKIAVL
ncbi:MAG: T9SS type A sorting domain-containing protein [Raineya sp.]|jgi:hypothetical protein|nr:T9SS type A sorting domain-containing protein [Raineya sp.]